MPPTVSQRLIANGFSRLLSASLSVAVLVVGLCVGSVACSPRELHTQVPTAFELFQGQVTAHPLAHTLNEGEVTTDAGDYHYVEMGEGPTVILYHGFPSFWYAWKTIIPVLADHFHVVAVDGLGANLSAKPTELDAYRISALADQLGQVIDKIAGEEPVFLVGHDWGGALVWSFSQAHPERVTAFASFSAPPLNLFLDLLSSDPAQQKASAYIGRVKSLAESDVPENAPALITQVGYSGLLSDGLISEADYQAFGAGLSRPDALKSTAMWYAANIPDPDDIGEVDFWPSRQASADVPGLLVWGEADKTFIGRFVGLAAGYAQPLSVVTISGVGHWPMLEASERSQTELLSFLLSHLSR